jgi:hypothetical protein
MVSMEVDLRFRLLARGCSSARLHCVAALVRRSPAALHGCSSARSLCVAALVRRHRDMLAAPAIALHLPSPATACGRTGPLSPAATELYWLRPLSRSLEAATSIARGEGLRLINMQVYTVVAGGAQGGVCSSFFFFEGSGVCSSQWALDMSRLASRRHPCPHG